MSGWQSMALTALRQNQRWSHGRNPSAARSSGQTSSACGQSSDSGCSGIATYSASHAGRERHNRQRPLRFYGGQLRPHDSNSVVSHELGHNFGCQHDREKPWRPWEVFFQYGYVLRKNGCSTVRSWPTRPTAGYFQSECHSTEPGVGCRSACRSPAGRSLQRADHGEGRFRGSRFRLQQQSAAGAGTLVSVSTRAFVGTGEKQLIAVSASPAPNPDNCSYVQRAPVWRNTECRECCGSNSPSSRCRHERTAGLILANDN